MSTMPERVPSCGAAATLQSMGVLPTLTAFRSMTEPYKELIRRVRRNFLSQTTAIGSSDAGSQYRRWQPVHEQNEKLH